MPLPAVLGGMGATAATPHLKVQPRPPAHASLPRSSPFDGSGRFATFCRLPFRTGGASAWREGGGEKRKGGGGGTGLLGERSDGVSPSLLLAKWCCRFDYTLFCSKEGGGTKFGQFYFSHCTFLLGIHVFRLFVFSRRRSQK